MAELLVVASKVKNFIKSAGDLNTSSATLELLSKQVEKLCEKAIQNAKNDGRKTVMDRDVPNLD